MLLINGCKYATSDSEMVDSLFNDGDGTLSPLYKIQKKHQNNGDAVLYWTDEDSGVYIWKPSGVWGKFRKLANGRIFAQNTLDEITLTEEG